MFFFPGNYSEGFGEEDPKRKWAPTGIAAPPSSTAAVAAISKEAKEEKQEEGKQLERRVSLKGLTMKEIEHAQELFEKYDTNFDKKIDKGQYFSFKQLLFNFPVLIIFVFR